MKLSLLLLVASLSACAQTQTVQESPKAIEGVPLHSALLPAERLGEDWWKERFEASEKRVAAGNSAVVFLGDSITQGWEGEGRDAWQRHFARYEPINLGFSGDRTQHVLWRLERYDFGALATPAAGSLATKCVVVMIGTNNSNGADNTAEEIADGVTAIVHVLRAKLPKAKVLLLAVFPRGEQPNAQREKNAKASELFSKCADGKHVVYLDIGPKFLAANGVLPKETMPDFLHLSPAGYEIWANAIDAELKALVGS
ncbi:MAG: GDSL family lipase [Planctomycetes bacterium]|nr:GDSL family lipase [Planctomycetota bacterium]